MIHSINTLTIRKYGIIDETGNLSGLRKWYNPFPVEWFDTDKFFEEFKTIFSENNSDLLNEKYRILAFYKIIELDTISKTLVVLMQSENNRSLFSILFKKKIKNINIDFYTDKIKSLTGIEVKDGKDLEKLKNELQRLLDKYTERFKKKEVKSNVSFLEVVLGVFSMMEMDFIPEMTLAEFGRLKKLADKKIKDVGHK